MTLYELQNQALQLSIHDRWYLIQSLLDSIRQDTRLQTSHNLTQKSLCDLDSWTESLIGVIEFREEPIESYRDYLEEKYS